MFDMDNIPLNRNIESASACFYLSNDPASTTIGVYNIHNWDGQNETTLTWNNQACGTNFDDSTDCRPGDALAVEDLSSGVVGTKLKFQLNQKNIIEKFIWKLPN